MLNTKYIYTNRPDTTEKNDLEKQLSAQPEHEINDAFYENLDSDICEPAGCHGLSSYHAESIEAPVQFTESTKKSSSIAMAIDSVSKHEKFMKSATIRYCPVIGYNVFVEILSPPGMKQDRCTVNCCNSHNCDKERGGCANTIFSCVREQL